jgi:hypothetical protein
MRASSVLVSLVAGALAMACAPAMTLHRFGPETVEVEVGVEGYAGDHVWAVASVDGIRDYDAETGRGPQVEIRLRLENRSRGDVALEPRSIALVSADLRSIGRAEVEPEPRPLAAGETADYFLVFPFPRDVSPWDYDLRRLDLSWALDFGADLVRSRARFTLTDPIHDPGLERHYHPHGY